VFPEAMEMYAVSPVSANGREWSHNESQLSTSVGPVQPARSPQFPAYSPPSLYGRFRAFAFQFGMERRPHQASIIHRDLVGLNVR